MTPKEKAEELFDEFGNIDYMNASITDDFLKQCALICVEMNEDLLYNLCRENTITKEDYLYCLNNMSSIKKEIEKL